MFRHLHNLFTDAYFILIRIETVREIDVFRLLLYLT